MEYTERLRREITVNSKEQKASAMEDMAVDSAIEDMEDMAVDTATLATDTVAGEDAGGK